MNAHLPSSMADFEVKHKELYILYENWQGKTRWRCIIPSKLYLGNSPYHTEIQWLLEAIDVGKQEVRTFALLKIRSFSKTNPEEAKNEAAAEDTTEVS